MLMLFRCCKYNFYHKNKNSDGGSGDEEVLLICEENVNCRFGGKCVTDGHFGYRCDCNKNCKAVR